MFLLLLIFIIVVIIIIIAVIIAGDYVLVCGFGRVGQAVCELLTSKLVRYKAFDLDPYRVAEARALGLPVFYGDARRPDVLQAIDQNNDDDDDGRMCGR